MPYGPSRSQESARRPDRGHTTNRKNKRFEAACIDYVHIRTRTPVVLRHVVLYEWDARREREREIYFDLAILQTDCASRSCTAEYRRANRCAGLSGRDEHMQ